MAEFKDITREELKKWMDEEKDFALVDVLEEQSYEARHLPGAKNVPGGDDFIERVSKVAPDKDKTIVVYCSSFTCQASPTAASELVEAGYKDVYDFRGGLADWQDGGFDFEKASSQQRSV